ncbi:MAG: response regulator [Xenococcaceae cyanobacterium]
MKILLIEDDELVAQTLAKALTDQHYMIDVAADGQAGWELLDAFTYDLIVLDVMLPKLDGISLCQRLRSRGLRMPIILLTAQDTSTNKVLGLDAGADDYVTKPFDLQELSARIRALLRRGNSTLPPVLKWGNLHLDPSTCEVTYNSQPIHLTPKEYALLELFLRNSHRVFSRSAILDHLWSFEASPGEETVTAHIKGLRQKLKAVGLSQDPIETVYGIGYRLKPVKQQQTRGKRKKVKKQKRLSPDVEQQAISAAIDVWKRVKEKFSRRVAVIEKATTAILKDTLGDELRQQAEQEAHKLAGSLGMFDFDEGSRLAREMEQLFHAGMPLNQEQRQHLSELVVAMRRELERATTGQNPKLLSVDEKPLLLIVEKDRTLAQEFVIEANTRGMRTEIVTDPTVARERLSRKLPDAVLLDLSLAEYGQDSAALQNNLNLLGELRSCTPPVPVMVLTAQDSLIDRVKIARLGGRGFLQKPMPPTQVLEAVTQVLQQTSTAQAKVMVVDDDPQVLTALVTLLEPWGIKLFTLENPLQFWDTLEAASPDLLILDVEMPHISGIELCQVVRNDLGWAGLPVLFLTAHTDAQTMHRVFEAGADDYVSKPIVGPELVTRILNRLERSRLQRNLAETDTLTGVVNRHKSIQELTQFLHQAERQNQPFCFAILDLDRLKQVNDQYGHAVGDRILSRLGKLLRRNFQSEDVVSRWGGAEFVVGMYGMTRSDGVRRLSELLEILRQEEFTAPDGTPFQVTFSAGVVQYPQDSADLQGLYRAANAILLQAKAAGCDRILSGGEPSGT